jgi:hypothetical protein
VSGSMIFSFQFKNEWVICKVKAACRLARQSCAQKPRANVSG